MKDGGCGHCATPWKMSFASPPPRPRYYATGTGRMEGVSVPGRPIVSTQLGLSTHSRPPFSSSAFHCESHVDTFGRIQTCDYCGGCLENMMHQCQLILHGVPFWRTTDLRSSEAAHRTSAHTGHDTMMMGATPPTVADKRSEPLNSRLRIVNTFRH